MSILTAAKKLNNNYFQLPYALMEKTRKPSKLKALFKNAPDDVQDEVKSPFTPKDKPHLTYSARLPLVSHYPPCRLSYEAVSRHTAMTGHREENPKASWRYPCLY